MPTNPSLPPETQERPPEHLAGAVRPTTWVEASAARRESLRTPQYQPGRSYRAFSVDYDIAQGVEAYMRRYGNKPEFCGLDPFGTLLVLGPIPEDNDIEPGQLQLPREEQP